MRKFIFMILAIAIFAGPASAAKLYKWRDASGAQHFTDNPAAVPAKHRASAPIDVNALESTSSGGKAPSSSENGIIHWQRLCAKCHYLKGEKPRSAQISLAGIGIDSVSKFPETPDAVFGKLKAAVDGSDKNSDMEPMSVPDKVLQDIASYLLEKDSN